MRWTTFATAAIAASFSPCLTACGEPSPSAKKVQKELGETWDAMKTWSVEKKDDFVRSASPKVEEAKQKFAEWRTSAAETNAEAKKSLEADWVVVEQKFDAMKTASADQWSRHRDAFVDAYDAFKRKLASSPTK